MSFITLAVRTMQQYTISLCIGIIAQCQRVTWAGVILHSDEDGPDPHRQSGHANFDTISAAFPPYTFIAADVAHLKDVSKVCVPC